LFNSFCRNIHTYKKGVSLILRDSIEASDSTSEDNLTASFEKHVCITDHKSVVRERVGDKLFEFKAGAFFQNNNSILLPLTTYVRDAIFPPDPSPQATNSNPTHLVDTYCGSGLFAITLSPHFEQVAGIEVDQNAIKAAANNAELNNLPSGKCTFRTGDAADIFSAVGEFPRDRTVTIIDPPRKGSDDKFIDQLMNFGCGTVVYVSCNVHTQARDVGKILRKTVPDGRKYVLESLRGFDLFPQTAHVESVAVLRLSPSS
jgi:tRNA (uracil-5-)-methyltransferase